MLEPIMNFKQKVENIIRLAEQANKRSDVESSISSASYQVILHFIAVLLFGKDCEAINHWCGELHGWLNNLSTIILKGNKKIKYEDLKKWIHEEWLDENNFRDFIDTVIFKESVFNPIGAVYLESHYKDFIIFVDDVLYDYLKEPKSNSYLKNKILEWCKKADI